MLLLLCFLASVAGMLEDVIMKMSFVVKMERQKSKIVT